MQELTQLAEIGILISIILKMHIYDEVKNLPQIHCAFDLLFDVCMVVLVEHTGGDLPDLLLGTIAVFFDLVPKQHKLVIDIAQRIFHLLHVLAVEGAGDQVRIVFIKQHVVELAPEKMDHGFDLKLAVDISVVR